VISYICKHCINLNTCLCGNYIIRR